MIFVILGTQDKPFTRLLKALEKEIKKGNITEPVIVQAGSTIFKSKYMEIHDYLDMKTFNDYIKKCDMGTYGEYSSWYFDENMSECDESYYDGLDEANWIVKNYDWIKDMFDEKNIHITRELLGELYDKISAEDFRSGSCGGCI